MGAELRIGRQRHSIDGQALVRERTKTGGHRTVLLDAVTVAEIGAWREEAEMMAGAPGTAAQAELLRDLGCGRAQGYFFGRPAAAGTLAARVSSAVNPGRRR